MGFGAIEFNLGWIGYACSGKGLSRLTLPVRSREEAIAALGERVRCRSVREDGVEGLGSFLAAYFGGDPADASSFTLDLEGCTEFQTRVLGCVRAIPRGEVLTYGQVAAEVGRPGAARAVGSTMAANPIPIIIPCHRVTGSGGSLGGFSGGLQMKIQMLEMEGALKPVKR